MCCLWTHWSLMSAKREDHKFYYSDFPWNDLFFCERPICLCWIHYVVDKQVSIYSNDIIYLKKVGFILACSYVVKDREETHIKCCNHPSVIQFYLDLWQICYVTPNIFSVGSFRILSIPDPLITYGILPEMS